MDSSRLSGYDDDDVFDPANPAFEEPPCRVCGCTDLNSESFVSRTGAPGHWVDSDLCNVCDFDTLIQVVRYTIAVHQEECVEVPTRFLVELIRRHDHLRSTQTKSGPPRLLDTVHSLIKIDEKGDHWIDGRFGSVRRRIRCGTLEEAQTRLAELR